MYLKRIIHLLIISLPFCYCGAVLADEQKSALDTTLLMAAEDAVPARMRDPYRPHEDLTASRCFNVLESTRNETNGSDFATVDFIENKFKLDELRKKSKSIEASGGYGAFSASASYSKKERYSRQFEKNALFWAVTFERKYEPTESEEIGLTPRGLEIHSRALEQASPGFYFDQCGREYRSEYIKGASIVLLYKIEASSESKKRSIREAMDGSASYGSIGSVSGSSSSLSQLKTIDEGVQIFLEVRQRGVPQNQQLVQALSVTDYTDIGAMKVVIDDTLKDLSWDDAIILRETYQRLPLILRYGMDDKLSFLRTISEKLSSADSREYRIQTDLRFLNRLHDDFVGFDSEEFDSVALQAKKKELFELNRAVVLEVEQCKEFKNEQSCKLNSLDQNLPDVDYRDFYSGKILDTSGFTIEHSRWFPWDKYHPMMIRYASVPKMEIVAPHLVRKIELIGPAQGLWIGYRKGEDGYTDSKAGKLPSKIEIDLAELESQGNRIYANSHPQLSRWFFAAGPTEKIDQKVYGEPLSCRPGQLCAGHERVARVWNSFVKHHKVQSHLRVTDVAGNIEEVAIPMKIVGS
jgi:hypothetical protein